MIIRVFEHTPNHRMPTTHITRAELAHLDDIAPLFDAYRQFYEQKSDLALARSFLQNRLEHHQSVVLCARNAAGQAIGFCQMYPSFCSVEAAPIVVLYDLFVTPEARRTGAGRALLQAARRYAEDNGFARMDLTTAKTNIRAQTLYHSLGWIQDEVFDTYNLHLQKTTASI